MKRIFMIIILLSAVTQLVLSEDLFRFLEDTPAWGGENHPLTDATADRIIRQGFVISGVSRPYLSNINGILSFCNSLFFQNIEYSVPANT
ncbi:MAG: CRISPR-associated endonuclease Cas1, partial [Treponema sp.]|nr:CRISPR-associated endonuclease Cas1 [Treponema sp.]